MRACSRSTVCHLVDGYADLSSMASYLAMHSTHAVNAPVSFKSHKFSH